jgi:hypothetical protein
MQQLPHTLCSYCWQQRGELDASSLLLSRTKVAIKDAKQGLIKAAEAGHIDVVKGLHQLGVRSG